MKKILAIVATGLLTVGFVGCNGNAGGSSEAMDSLSMAFGDLYGAGMGQQMRAMDSTINIEEALKGMECGRCRPKSVPRGADPWIAEALHE